MRGVGENGDLKYKVIKSWFKAINLIIYPSNKDQKSLILYPIIKRPLSLGTGH